jgi:hypothetical protein
LGYSVALYLATIFPVASHPCRNLRRNVGGDLVRLSLRCAYVQKLTALCLLSRRTPLPVLGRGAPPEKREGRTIMLPSLSPSQGTQFLGLLAILPSMGTTTPCLSIFSQAFHPRISAIGEPPCRFALLPEFFFPGFVLE